MPTCRAGTRCAVLCGAGQCWGLCPVPVSSRDGCVCSVLPPEQSPCLQLQETGLGTPSLPKNEGRAERSASFIGKRKEQPLKNGFILKQRLRKGELRAAQAGYSHRCAFWAGEPTQPSSAWESCEQGVFYSPCLGLHQPHQLQGGQGWCEPCCLGSCCYHSGTRDLLLPPESFLVAATLLCACPRGACGAASSVFEPQYPTGLRVGAGPCPVLCSLLTRR